MNIDTTSLDSRPTFEGQRLSDRILGPGMGILLTIVIWVPLAMKTDKRLGLDGLSILPGLDILNLFLCIGLVSAFRTPRPELLTDSARSWFQNAMLAMLGFSLIACFTVVLVGGPDVFWPAFVEWKRWGTIMLVYLFALRFIRTRKQLRAVLYCMSFVIIYAAINLLRENFSNGMSSHYRDGLRFGGIFDWGGENDLAAFFSEFIFIPLALVFTGAGKLVRVLLLCGAALVAVACLFTYSRASYIALAAGLAVYLFRKGGRGIIIFLILLAIAFPLLPASVVERWNMTHDEKTGKLEQSAALRVAAWNEGMRLIKEYPFLGIGYDRFVHTVRLPEFHDIPLEAHNSYLKIATEQGVPAMLAFVAMILASLLLTRNPRDAFERELFYGFSGCVVAFAVSNFFGNRFLRETLTCYYWIFAAIIVWLRGQRRESSHEGQASEDVELMEQEYAPLY